MTARGCLVEAVAGRGRPSEGAGERAASQRPVLGLAVGGTAVEAPPCLTTRTRGRGPSFRRGNPRVAPRARPLFVRDIASGFRAAQAGRIHGLSRRWMDVNPVPAADTWGSSIAYAATAALLPEREQAVFSSEKRLRRVFRRQDTQRRGKSCPWDTYTMPGFCGQTCQCTPKTSRHRGLRSTPRFFLSLRRRLLHQGVVVFCGQHCVCVVLATSSMSPPTIAFLPVEYTPPPWRDRIVILGASNYCARCSSPRNELTSSYRGSVAFLRETPPVCRLHRGCTTSGRFAIEPVECCSGYYCVQAQIERRQGLMMRCESTRPAVPSEAVPPAVAPWPGGTFLRNSTRMFRVKPDANNADTSLSPQFGQIAS